MSKGNTLENDWLKLLFQATGIANIADNAASAPLTNLYLTLHTADPGEAGSQTTSEVAYTGFARLAIARTSGGWSITNNQVSNTAAATMGEKTAGSDQTATHWSIGTASSGAGKILYKGPLASAFYGAFTAKANDTITIPGHGLAVDDRVVFYPITGVAIPTGMTEGTIYFVKTVSGDDITIATTSGGSTVDLTTVGGGVALKAKPILISNGGVPEFAIGQLLINED